MSCTDNVSQKDSTNHTLDESPHRSSGDLSGDVSGSAPGNGPGKAPKNTPNNSPVTSQRIADWLLGDEGQAVLQREHERVRAQLKRATIVMPCETVFQPRCWFAEEQLRGHGALKLYTATRPPADDYWPLPPERVDLLLLPHEFELTDDPHALLRWADSVLVENGWLMITGFKPAGLLAWLFGGKMGKGWSEQSVTGSMLRLWLNEGGYKVVDQEKWPYANLLPRQLPTILGLSLRWLEALLPKRRAYGYLLVARKIVVPVMPTRSKWPAIADSFMPAGAQRVGQAYSNSPYSNSQRLLSSTDTRFGLNSKASNSRTNSAQ